MLVTIHQPNFMPRLKVLEKIAAADLWIVLDDLQYCGREWQNRARLRPLAGPADYWVSLPVHRSRGRDSVIREVGLVRPDDALARLRRGLQRAYGRSVAWPWIENYGAGLRARATQSLCELAVESTRLALAPAGFPADRIAYSSELGVRGSGTEKLVGLCRAVGANRYFSGSGGRNYLREDVFEKAGITVSWQNWKEPETPAAAGPAGWRNYSFLSFLAWTSTARLQERLSRGTP